MFIRHGVPSITSRQPSHRIATLSLTIVGIRTPRYSIARMLPDRRGPAGREDRNTWSHGRASSAALVPPRGFEPLISTLKGWRPGPLDDGGATLDSMPKANGRAAARKAPDRR